ncbi:MAG TPA: histidine ammonia-lyase [Thermoleophilia bacterium]|nr:histidine ammonia-lyase [Thermoleophilia bacterium]
MADTLELTGHDLSIADVERAAFEPGLAVVLSTGALAQIDAARALIDRVVDERIPTYGVNTGFGRFVDVHIERDQVADLQLNLLRSHACGVGEPFPDEVVRAALLLRANTLAKGASGVRRVVVERLLELLHRDVVPVVPSRGSLGASGDLAPLAHLALVLVGEGFARGRDGRPQAGADALAAAGLEPLELAAKEGLSLINGTQFMAAIGALVCARARRLVRIADLAAAQSVEALRGSRTPFAPELQALRPHPGQADSAANLYRLLDDSQIVASHRWCGRVQDAYSLRCTPQVHGAVRDMLAHAERTVTIELNSATDNPLVLADRAEVVSNGNFHGEPIAIALDALKIALAELANIAERRIERLLNPTMNEGQPAFLTRDGGFNSGFMIAQYAAASLVSENKVLAHPASVDSIPTSAGQEDHVSMGATSAVHLWAVCANVERVLAIELLCAAQGLDFLEPLRPGRAVAALHDAVRARSDHLERDRSLAAEIEQVAADLRDGSLLTAVESAAGALA